MNQIVSWEIFCMSSDAVVFQVSHVTDHAKDPCEDLLGFAPPPLGRQVVPKIVQDGGKVEHLLETIFD